MTASIDYVDDEGVWTEYRADTKEPVSPTPMKVIEYVDDDGVWIEFR